MPDKADKLAQRAYWIATASYLKDDLFAKMALELELDGAKEASDKIKLCYSLMGEVYDDLGEKWGGEIAEATGKRLLDTILDAMNSAREKFRAAKN